MSTELVIKEGTTYSGTPLLFSTFKEEVASIIKVTLPSTTDFEIRKPTSREYTLTIHYPIVEITNSANEHYTAYDFFIKILFGTDYSNTYVIYKNMSFTRTTVTEREYEGNWFHPHIKGTIGVYSSNFCLGTGPLKRLLETLSSGGNLNLTNTAMFALLTNLDTYLKWESIEGGPYVRIPTLLANVPQNKYPLTNERYKQTSFAYAFITAAQEELLEVYEKLLNYLKWAKVPDPAKGYVYTILNSHEELLNLLFVVLSKDRDITFKLIELQTGDFRNVRLFLYKDQAGSYYYPTPTIPSTGVRTVNGNTFIFKGNQIPLKVRASAVSTTNYSENVLNPEIGNIIIQFLLFKINTNVPNLTLSASECIAG